MRSPIPKNRLVSLTLVGALLVAAVSMSLAFPGVLPGQTDNNGEKVGSLPSDAPTPNPNFTPAVQQSSGEDHEEHEGYEDEHEEGEHEEYDSLGTVEMVGWG